MSASPATSSDSRHPLFAALLIALVVAALNIGLWWWGNRPHGPDDWHGPINGFSVSVFQRYQNPLKQDFPSDAEIDGDLKLLRRYTGRIRTYSTLENPQVYRLARQEGLEVMAGANIDTRLNNNERELEGLIELARRYPGAIERVIVGNEALFRGDITVEQAIAYLDRARAQIRQPVSIAEPDYIWIKYPELAEHVDFITIHLFPFWNGVARKDAVGAALGAYDNIRHLYPDKHVV
ncbi:MAG TPA: hypothetical protein VHA37_02955, partial [Candidatus Saccharimonadales bacterium]|nr:hypothetical protein [Candidatus Saccharimonadales bacterium]